MMSLMGTLLVLLALGLGIALVVHRTRSSAERAALRSELDALDLDPDEIEMRIGEIGLSLPSWSVPALATITAVGMLGGIFDQMFFYAEPGYIYHVRTITGNEKVVSDVGYNLYLFGRYNAWKRAMTVQAVASSHSASLQAESDDGQTSASMPPLNIIFLDQVDAHVEATVRYSIPTDRETFLHLAHEYRSPDNLLRTALIPAFKETLHATGSIMSAESYYSGGRTEFNAEFESQMSNGITLVRRDEVRVAVSRDTKGSANAALGRDQSQYGDEDKVTFVVQKVLDEDGQPIRKEQNFVDYGIQVIDARVTDMRPNEKFVERMQLKQKASADRAIAREQRIQEEEQRLLAIATGEREVAERQASAKVTQIQRTTEAQTEKQLAITKAEKMREEANIHRDTAQINLEKARVDAETRRTLADAEAYQKRIIIEADNALAQKLEAEVTIHELWASAFAQRKVPTTVFGGGSFAGGGSGVSVGADSEVKAFMQLLTLDAAERLSYERGLKQVSAQ